MEDKQKEATVHFQLPTTLHFLQKQTFENFLTFIPLSVFQTCEKQISQRNEDQSACKIQEQTDAVEMSKFTPWKMDYCLLLFIFCPSAKITHAHAQCIIICNGESAYKQHIIQVLRIIKITNKCTKETKQKTVIRNNV